MKLAKIAERTIEYGFYTLFFLTPLLFNPSRTLPSFELFEWNKMMFVYATTTVITSAWIARMIIGKKIIFRRTPFDLPLLFFLFSQSLATLFSIDRHVSVFGYYSRFHGGLLSIITYTFLYYALAANWHLIRHKNLFLFTFSAGVVVATYGILEKFGIDAQMWVQDVRARVFSTLGQPNWLAAYLAVLLPLTFPGLITANGNNAQTHPKKFSIFKFRIIGKLLLASIFYLCLLFTRSRSGFLGFWTASGIFWLLLLYLNRRGFIRILPLFILLNVSFTILNFFVRTPFAQYNRYLTVDLIRPQPRIAETAPPVGDTIINIGITDSGKIRRIVWQGALSIVRDYPLFGTGPETFAYAYYKYRPAAHNLTSEWDFLYNRAHNEFLNVAATSGLFGLGTYLFLIFSVIIWTSRQLLTKKRGNSETLIMLALMASYTSILITNFFGFSVVVVGLAFFLIPAIISGFNHSQSTALRATQTFALPIRLTYFFISLDALAVLFIFALLARLWVSDSLYARALGFSRQELNKEAYSPISLAVNLNPDEPVYRDEKAGIASALAAQALENSEGTTAATLTQEALNESTRALTISPQNVNFWKTRTRVLYLLSTADPAFTDAALQAIMVAAELAPTDAKIAYNVAVLLGRAGKNTEAIEMLKKTIALKPDYRDAYIALAVFYEEEKLIDEAKQILKRALERINPDDQEIKDRLEKFS